MQGFEAGEKEIRSFATELEQFSDDPGIAASLVSIQRTLLFHSRAFTDDEITELVAKMTGINARHASNTEVRKMAGDGPLIAMLAIASDRKRDAITRYFELRKLIGAELEEDPDAQTTLCTGLATLLESFDSRYPAWGYRLWCDASCLMRKGPRGREATSEWVKLAMRLLRDLRKPDPFAAFGIWLQGLAWSKLSEVDPATQSMLVTGAYLLIQKEPDESLNFNDALWTFILTADASREHADSVQNTRMMSILAALDMAVGLFAQRKTSLLNQFVALKAATETSDGRIRLDLTVLDREPELRNAVDQLDQQMSVYFDAARCWIQDDLVWLSEWPSLINDLNILEDQIFWRGSAASKFRSNVIDMTRVARQKGAQAAWNKLNFSEDLLPWIDRPLIPTAWDELREPGELRSILSPLVLPHAVLHATKFTVERVRTTRLLCYKDLLIVEVQIRFEPGTHGILSFVTLPSAQVVHLDATSGPIHNLNKHFLSDLDQPSIVLDYLMFFTHEVWGEEGPFRIVRLEADIPFRESPGEELSREIANLLIPDPQPVEDLDGDWRVTAIVQYGDSLFKATFEINRKGMIEMLTDKALLPELRVRKFKMVNGVRTLEESV